MEGLTAKECSVELEKQQHVISWDAHRRGRLWQCPLPVANHATPRGQLPQNCHLTLLGTLQYRPPL